MEKFTCNLIVTGIIPKVNINRTLRVINLKARKETIDTLDEWGSNVKKLTDILNQVIFFLLKAIVLFIKVSHLILKEEMVHKHLEINGRV